MANLIKFFIKYNQLNNNLYFIIFLCYKKFNTYSNYFKLEFYNLYTFSGRIAFLFGFGMV